MVADKCYHHAELVLATLLPAFKFELSKQTICWNAAGVSYPSVGQHLTKPAMPLFDCAVCCHVVELSLGEGSDEGGALVNSVSSSPAAWTSDASSEEGGGGGGGGIAEGSR